MTSTPNDDLKTRNGLLNAMSRDDRALLAPRLSRVMLERRMHIEPRNQPIRNVYFFESGLASIVGITDTGVELEVSLIGCEGIGGVAVIHGADQSPHETFMQIAGEALVMEATEFRKALEASATLNALMLRFAQAASVQIAHTAITNGRFTINARLARWLLMCHDRVKNDELALTHEFLSTMLGVRRPGVTNALHILEGMHMIRARRGMIHILDRDKLVEMANGCYGTPEEEYRRLIHGEG